MVGRLKECWKDDLKWYTRENCTENKRRWVFETFERRINSGQARRGSPPVVRGFRQRANGQVD